MSESDASSPPTPPYKAFPPAYLPLAAMRIGGDTEKLMQGKAAGSGAVNDSARTPALLARRATSDSSGATAT
jgi:hypothetical protein